jgi:hypothetical protein
MFSTFEMYDVYVKEMFLKIEQIFLKGLSGYQIRSKLCKFVKSSCAPYGRVKTAGGERGL